MLKEKIATDVGPSKIDIAYEELGDRADPTVLLVMGLGAQLVHWPSKLLDALLARRLHLVRFDNRDSGCSTHMHGARVPNLGAALQGDLSSASYTLSDMAADGVGLLDALGIGAAHVVGASLGGEIAQTMAIEHRDRVLSLTSIMATTGASDVGQPHPATLHALLGGPPARTRDEVILRAVRASDVVGSPAYPADRASLERTAALAYDRSYDEAAIARQAVAQVASGDRTERLRRVDVPTLVVHGLADTLRDPSGGRATAAAIPGAELVLVEGMGHDLPPALCERVAELVARVVARGEKNRSDTA